MQMNHERNLDPSLPEPVAGVLAGLAGGLAYLLAQMGFAATMHHGTGFEPLERISALLLGDQFLPVTGDVNLTIAGFGLLIHLGLAIVFGRLVDVLVRGGSLHRGILTGAMLGVAWYALNYWVIAPIAFPWFTDARGATTVLDHLLFGALTGAAYCVLRPRWRQLLTRTPAARGS